MNSLTREQIQEITETVLAKYKVEIWAYYGNRVDRSTLVNEISHALIESERRAELAEDIRAKSSQAASAAAKTNDHYIGRINGLIGDLQSERAHAADASATRNLSLAITHLEDALLRISPSLHYQPNPGARA